MAGPTSGARHLKFIEPESEHSSASAAEGFALAGGRVTNFTAGQGLVLMKEVLYVISGKRLPVVFHVGARALTSQALNIHAGHDDVMAVADTGWGILFARNVQEAADLTAIARRVAEETETPFLVAQDGFLTTHTLENARLPEDELLREFVGDPRLRIRDLFDPAEALMTGVVQNQDSYMKGRIAQRAWYDRIPSVLAQAMAEWEVLTGRHYGLIDSYRADDAERIVVAMGTIADSLRDVVDHLRASGIRAGAVTVTSFRPFPARELAKSLAAAKAVAVIERTDEPAASANPLTRELKAALADVAASGERIPRVVSASGGLGSRDVSSADLVAVYDWLANESLMAERPYAVLGVKHPLALEAPDIEICAAWRLQPARPLDWRIRIRDRQQAAGERNRRPVGPVRPGLPALRLGEARAADDLLPDNRRGAHPPAQRAALCRARPAPRRERVRPGRPSCRPRRRRDPVPEQLAHRSGAIWGSIPPTPGPRSLLATSMSWLSIRSHLPSASRQRRSSRAECRERLSSVSSCAWPRSWPNAVYRSTS